MCRADGAGGEAGLEAPPGSCLLSLQPAKGSQGAGAGQGTGAPGDSGDTQGLVTAGCGPPQRGQADTRDTGLGLSGGLEPLRRAAG